MKPLFKTVPQMLYGHAAATPDAPALIVPDRGILTFGDLAELARDALEFLNARGLGARPTARPIAPSRWRAEKG